MHRRGSAGRSACPNPNRLSRPIGRLWCSFAPSPPRHSPSYDGRAEHVVSGQVARFHSLEELLAFMVRVLTDVQDESNSS